MTQAGWPVWKTDARLVRPLGVVMWLAIGFVTIVLPPAIGGTVYGMINLLGLEATMPFGAIGSIGMLLLASGFFAWIGVAIGVGVCIVALRKGYAGWGSAILLGVVLSTIVFCVLFGTLSFVGIMSFFGLMGGLYAGSLWLGLRWLVPEFFK